MKNQPKSNNKPSKYWARPPSMITGKSESLEGKKVRNQRWIKEFLKRCKLPTRRKCCKRSENCALRSVCGLIALNPSPGWASLLLFAFSSAWTYRPLLFLLFLLDGPRLDLPAAKYCVDDGAADVDPSSDPEHRPPACHGVLQKGQRSIYPVYHCRHITGVKMWLITQ